MDKYTTLLESLPFNLLHIAQSYANDNKSPKIEPAHLLRALLHKSAGLVNFIEDTLDEDYYYLVDWADMRMQQCEKSAYGMKGVVLSRDSQSVVREAMDITEKCGLESLTAASLLASIVTPGIGFSYDQLKTLPLRAEKIIQVLQSGAPAKSTASSSATNQQKSTSGDISQEYCVPMLSDVPESPVIGFDSEVLSIVEVLARKDRANILIVGETGVGKTSLLRALIRR